MSYLSCLHGEDCRMETEGEEQGTENGGREGRDPAAENGTGSFICSMVTANLNSGEPQPCVLKSRGAHISPLK